MTFEYIGVLIINVLRQMISIHSATCSVNEWHFARRRAHAAAALTAASGGDGVGGVASQQLCCPCQQQVQAAKLARQRASKSKHSTAGASAGGCTTAGLPPV